MKKYKGPQIKYIETPLTRFQKVNRWGLCQTISKVLYHSNRSEKQLEQIFKRYKEMLRKEFQ